MRATFNKHLHNVVGAFQLTPKLFLSSIDGWEVSLTNFVLPNQSNGGSDDSKWMYCVSLVFRRSSTARPQISEREISNQCVLKFQCDDSYAEEAGPSFQSPLFATESEGDQCRGMKVTQELEDFNDIMAKEQKWSQDSGSNAIIGLALICSRNTAHAMRGTLSLLYDDWCSLKCEKRLGNRASQHLCQPLVDILGVFAHSGADPAALSCLLEPYQKYITSEWIHRPLKDQSDDFLKASGMQLLQALPPVPLALVFVTLLLEQKVRLAGTVRPITLFYQPTFSPTCRNPPFSCVSSTH